MPSTNTRNRRRRVSTCRDTIRTITASPKEDTLAEVTNHTQVAVIRLRRTPILKYPEPEDTLRHRAGQDTRADTHPIPSSRLFQVPEVRRSRSLSGSTSEGQATRLSNQVAIRPSKHPIRDISPPSLATHLDLSLRSPATQLEVTAAISHNNRAILLKRPHTVGSHRNRRTEASRYTTNSTAEFIPRT